MSRSMGIVWKNNFPDSWRGEDKGEVIGRDALGGEGRPPDLRGDLTAGELVGLLTVLQSLGKSSLASRRTLHAAHRQASASLSLRVSTLAPLDTALPPAPVRHH